MLPEAKTIPREYMEIGKNLIFQLTSKKITMKEFEVEVAHLSLECGFNELYPQPLPTRPDILVEYDQLPLDKKQSMPASFWKHPAVISYMRQVSMIEAENGGKKWWIGILMNRFDKIGDIMNKNKCVEILNEFEGVPF